jgi:hypothetical protein
VSGSRGNSQRNIGPNSTHPITPQNEITSQFMVDINLPKKRRQSVQNPSKFIGVLTEDRDVSVMEDEMVFVLKGGNRLVDTGSSSIGFSGTGWTSFTGLPIPRDVKTDEQLADLVQFVGFSNTTVPFGKTVTRSGIAVRRHGSGTTVNNSNRTFFPGDIFGWELPSIHASRRAIQASRFPDTTNVPQNKLIATPRLIHYSDIVDWGKRGAKFAINENKKLHIPSYRKRSPNTVRTTGALYEIAMHYKQYLLFAAWNALMVAVQTGLVTPTYEQAGLKPAQRHADWQQIWRRTVEYNPHEWNQFEVDTNRTTNEIKFNSIKDDINKKETKKANMHEFAEFSAGILGLVADNRRPWIKEDTNLTKYLGMRTYLSLLNDRNTHSIAQVGKDFTTEGAHRNRFGDILSTPTISGQMHSLQRDCASTFARTMGYMYNHVMRPAIGTVSNVSPPGGPIHYAS